MRIPVFVSCPTALSPVQESSYNIVLSELEFQQFEPRALGRSDYPADCPLHEVFSIARICSGAIILGFSQYESRGGIWKRGTSSEREESDSACFPTPWNQLEAGMLYSLRLPMLVFREPPIKGGIFDPGVSDVFINTMPTPHADDQMRDGLRQLFLKWASKVRTHYHRDRY